MEIDKRNPLMIDPIVETKSTWAVSRCFPSQYSIIENRLDLFVDQRREHHRTSLDVFDLHFASSTDCSGCVVSSQYWFFAPLTLTCPDRASLAPIRSVDTCRNSHKRRDLPKKECSISVSFCCCLSFQHRSLRVLRVINMRFVPRPNLVWSTRTRWTAPVPFHFAS